MPGRLTAARGRPPLGPRLAALSALLFAVHAVDAGLVRSTATVPLAGPTGAVRGLRVTVAVPHGLQVAGTDGPAAVLELAEGDGLQRCRLLLRLRAEANARGIRSQPPLLVFGFDGVRRTIRTGPEVPAGGRRTWTGDLRALGVGAPPVESLARFSPPTALGLPPSVLLLVSAEAALDTSSPVQRTPQALAACSRRARRAAPGAVRTVLGTPEVTSARRGAP